jgi:hypothetical protein
MHGGWTELGPSTYSNATRPAFVPCAVSARSVDDAASLTVFDTVFDGDVYVVCSWPTTTKWTVLLARCTGVGDFDAPRAVTNGGTLTLQAAISFAPLRASAPPAPGDWAGVFQRMLAALAAHPPT